MARGVREVKMDKLIWINIILITINVIQISRFLIKSKNVEKVIEEYYIGLIYVIYKKYSEDEAKKIINTISNYTKTTI